MSLVRAPTLVIAGDADATVPIEQSLAIYEAAPEPKRLLVIEGGDHNDAALASGGAMVAEIVTFLETLGQAD